MLEELKRAGNQKTFEEARKAWQTGRITDKEWQECFDFYCEISSKKWER
jgi:hypothetical protein